MLPIRSRTLLAALAVLGSLLELVAAPVCAQVGLDPSFGSGGIAGTFGGDGRAGVSLALDPTGRILLGGWRSGVDDYAVARLLPNGSLDTSFGSGGIAGTFGGAVVAGVSLALDPTGRILLGGWRSGVGDYAVARLTGPFGFQGTVWLDWDADGLQDPGEPGIADSGVYLRDATGLLLDIAISDASGNFHVAHPTATRCYLEVAPDPLGYTVPTRYRIGTDPTVDSDLTPSSATAFLVPAIGADRTDVDAGLVPFDLLGDRAWNDLDEDGIQDANEPGLGLRLFQLLDSTGTSVVATAKASPYGHYAFPELAAGTYRLRVIVPPLLALTVPDAGPFDSQDSDFAPDTGLTVSFFYSGGYALQWDAGFVVPVGWIFSDGFEVGSTLAWSEVLP